MPLKKRFLAAVDGINARLRDYTEPGFTFAVHIWDKGEDRNRLAAHYLYGPEHAPWLDKDCGTPEHPMVIMTPPPKGALKIYPHRQLDVWVCYDKGRLDDTQMGKHMAGFVYDVHSRQAVARHIAAYLKTGLVPSVLGDVSKPIIQ